MLVSHKRPQALAPQDIVRKTERHTVLCGPAGTNCVIKYLRFFAFKRFYAGPAYSFLARPQVRPELVDCLFRGPAHIRKFYTDE